MNYPKIHPHAEMITEWVNDTNKKVMRYSESTEKWVEEPNPIWNPEIEYRFVEQPQDPTVSSLTDTEIREVFYDAKRAGRLRAIADAAAKRALQDLKAPSVKAYFAKKLIEKYLILY